MMERRLLDRAAILAGLEDLATELRRRDVHAKLFLVGGAAVAAAYDGRRVTKDVDLIVSPSAVVTEAAAAVARRRGWPPDWLDDGARVFAPDLRESGEVILESDSLQVAVGSARFILAMKLFSGREEDEKDVRVLAPLAGVITREAAWDLVERAYGGWFESANRAQRTRVRSWRKRRQIEWFIERTFPERSLKGRAVKATPSGGRTWVSAYRRQDGTEVRGHFRRH